MGEAGGADKDFRFGLLCLRLRAYAIHAGGGLSAPPVSEEQLRQAEARLGFRLPALLRRLYMTVANGAEFFMPGRIVYGIADELNSRPAGPGSIESVRGDGARLDQATVVALQEHPGAFVTPDAVPADFVVLCALGDTVSIWLDGLTGLLYASDNVLDHNGEQAHGFSFWAFSVEDWLERELAVEPRRDKGLHQPLVPLAGISTATQTPDTTLPNSQKQPQNPPSNSQLQRKVDVLSDRAHQWRERRRQEAQRLRLVRQEVVRLLGEVADIEYAVASETDKVPANTTWDDPVLKSLADAEAQLYAMVPRLY